MQPAKHFLFPFILLGMGLVFGLTRLLAEPGRAVLAAQEPQVLAASQPVKAWAAAEPFASASDASATPFPTASSQPPTANW